MQLSVENKLVLLDVARDAIRSALRGGAARAVQAGPQFEQPAGCFVSLHALRGRRLRGCVGRLEAKSALGLTVQTMAAAVLEDPRFLHNPVTWEELPELEIELSILSPLRLAEGPLAFDLRNEGIYLACADRSGCFLPQVARETGWTKEQLLERLCTEKLGVSSGAWRSGEARLYTFTTVLVGPEPFERA